MSTTIGLFFSYINTQNPVQIPRTCRENKSKSQVLALDFIYSNKNGEIPKAFPCNCYDLCSHQQQKCASAFYCTNHLQHAGGRTNGLQAFCDSSKPYCSDKWLLLGAFPCRHEVPVLLQEFQVASFSWDWSKACREASSQVQSSSPCQLLEVKEQVVFLLSLEGCNN